MTKPAPPLPSLITLPPLTLSNDIYKTGPPTELLASCNVPFVMVTAPLKLLVLLKTNVPAPIRAFSPAT
jgi:hypothetical protein